MAETEPRRRRLPIAILAALLLIVAALIAYKLTRPDKAHAIASCINHAGGNAGDIAPFSNDSKVQEFTADVGTSSVTIRVTDDLGAAAALSLEQVAIAQRNVKAATDGSEPYVTAGSVGRNTYEFAGEATDEDARIVEKCMHA